MHGRLLRPPPLAASHHYGLLTPPLAVATVARELVSGAASVWLSRCRGIGQIVTVDRRITPLPLLQNGACPFPCTQLLSVLMLVTPTPREIVPLLPRFRVVAVSMQRLQIGRARIASITTDVVDLDPVVM